MSIFKKHLHILSSHNSVTKIFTFQIKLILKINNCILTFNPKICIEMLLQSNLEALTVIKNIHFRNTNTEYTTYKNNYVYIHFVSIFLR